MAAAEWKIDAAARGSVVEAFALLLLGALLSRLVGSPVARSRFKAFEAC